MSGLCNSVTFHSHRGKIQATDAFDATITKACERTLRRQSGRLGLFSKPCIFHCFYSVSNNNKDTTGAIWEPELLPIVSATLRKSPQWQWKMLEIIKANMQPFVNCMHSLKKQPQVNGLHPWEFCWKVTLAVAILERGGTPRLSASPSCRWHSSLPFSTQPATQVRNTPPGSILPLSM